MISKFLLAGAAAAALSTCVAAPAANAATVTLDFTALPYGTAVTTQYPGVTVSLAGPGATGAPITGSFGRPYLGNSPTGNYPTNEILDFAFSSPVSNISFYFDNFGGYSSACSGFGGCSYATTNGSDGGSTYIGNLFEGGYGSVPGTHVTDLQFSNSGNNWEFGVAEVTYTTGVPEPSTWAMLLGGFGFIGYAMRRRVLRAA
jgi:hypothetical protein